MARRLLATAALALLSVLARGVAGTRARGRGPLHGEVITPYLNGADPYAAGQHRGVDIAGAAWGARGRRHRRAWSASPARRAPRGSRSASGPPTVASTSPTSTSRRSRSAPGSGSPRARGSARWAPPAGARPAAPHLHFGVRDAGSAHGYHDPLAFLPPPGGPGAPLAAPRAGRGPGPGIRSPRACTPPRPHRRLGGCPGRCPPDDRSAPPTRGWAPRPVPCRAPASCPSRPPPPRPTTAAASTSGGSSPAREP